MPPRAAPADPTLGLLMWDLGRAYYAYVGVAERILAAAGLADHVRPGMGLVLFALYEQDGRTSREVAARSELAASTLSGLLGRMEKGGLVRREKDGRDGRLVRVWLTDLGRRLEPDVRAMTARMSGIIEAGLGSERTRAGRLLRRLADALRAAEHDLAGE